MSLRSIVRIVLCVLVVVAFIGIVSADNDSITLYTDQDMKDAQGIISGSGVGLIVALIAISIQYAPVLIGAMLVLVVILSRLVNNADTHKRALQGIMVIVVVLLFWEIFISIIATSTPDISSFDFST